MKLYRIFMSVAVALAITSCAQKESNDKSADGKDSVVIEQVKTFPLELKKIPRTVENLASLEAWEELHFSPAAPGRIDEIKVDVGDKVQKGDLLVVMDETQLEQAKIQLASLQTEFDRLVTLYANDAVSQQNYDQLKSQLDLAQNNVDFLKKNTTLRAPFSGKVSGKYFEPGEMYSGTPIPTIGKSAVISLIQTRYMKILVSVSENYFPLINRKANLKVTTDVYPDHEFKATIDKIYPTIDEYTRTFKVEIRVNNSEDLLIPGMFARITIEFDEVEAMMIPSIALLKMKGSNQRYLFVDDSGVAKRIFVEVVQRFDDLIEVKSDELKPGDNIIYFGQARLIDGALVNNN